MARFGRVERSVFVSFSGVVKVGSIGRLLGGISFVGVSCCCCCCGCEDCARGIAVNGVSGAFVDEDDCFESN